MRYSSTHKQETRDKLLKEAAREIRLKGAEGVAVAGVMARAGLTHGGFYAHFASREAMVAAALDTMFAESRRRFDKAHADTPSPRARLAAYIDFYLSDLHRDDRERGCPLPTLSADLARGDGDARARFGQGVQSLTDRLAALLAELAWPDPAMTAASLLAEMVGAVALSRAVADKAQSDAILANTRAAIIRRFDLELDA